MVDFEWARLHGPDQQKTEASTCCRHSWTSVKYLPWPMTPTSSGGFEKRFKLTKQLHGVVSISSCNMSTIRTRKSERPNINSEQQSTSMKARLHNDVFICSIFQSVSTYASIKWGVYDNPPPDVPVCGFRSELCSVAKSGLMFNVCE